MKLVDDWKQAHKWLSVQIAGGGALAGALAAGLAASGTVVPWLGMIPNWAVFAGGAVICLLTIVGRLWSQSP